MYVDMCLYVRTRMCFLRLVYIWVAVYARQRILCLCVFSKIVEAYLGDRVHM